MREHAVIVCLSFHPHASAWRLGRGLRCTGNLENTCLAPLLRVIPALDFNRRTLKSKRPANPIHQITLS